MHKDQSDSWSASMASDALDCAREELGQVYVHWHEPAVEDELMKARHYIDRARAIVKCLDPDKVVGGVLP